MDIKKESYRIWKEFIISRWPIYLVGAFSVLMTNLMQILAPKNIGWIVDFMSGKQIPAYLIGKNNQETFLILFLILFVSRIIINVFRYGWRITLGRQTHYACGMLRREIWSHARYFKKKDLDTKFTKGILMNASAADSNSAKFIFGFTLIAIFDVFFLGLFTFIAMATIHLPMAILTVLFLFFIPFYVKKLSTQEVTQYRKTQDVLSEFNDLSSQAISTIRMQKLTQTHKYWEKRLLDVANKYRFERLKGVHLSLMYIPIMGVASLLSYVTLFVIGIYFTFYGKMTAGDFISMQGLIFLMHDPLVTLGYIISEWKKGQTALDRLTEVYLNEKDQTLLPKDNSSKNFESNEVLVVDNLTYSYKDSEPLIKNLSFNLNKGDRLGIYGPIGSGKTTLLNLLMGLNQSFDSGEIKFLGRKFNEYAHQDLRNYIGYVFQKPFLFADTIRVNISLDLNLSDEEIWKYLEIAGLKEDVENFPDKLETQLGEWGINLSGGQKQRLTLARALARRPRLLFLDDCLSAVDTLTEEKILKNLDLYLKDITLVWVAHRSSTLKYCDRTIRL